MLVSSPGNTRGVLYRAAVCRISRTVTEIVRLIGSLMYESNLESGGLSENQIIKRSDFSVPDFCRHDYGISRNYHLFF